MNVAGWSNGLQLELADAAAARNSSDAEVRERQRGAEAVGEEAGDHYLLQNRRN